MGFAVIPPPPLGELLVSCALCTGSIIVLVSAGAVCLCASEVVCVDDVGVSSCAGPSSTPGGRPVRLLS